MSLWTTSHPTFGLPTRKQRLKRMPKSNDETTTRPVGSGEAARG
jgi:NADH:ubiquinone reductase (H+-translocating)